MPFAATWKDLEIILNEVRQRGRHISYGNRLYMEPKKKWCR